MPSSEDIVNALRTVKDRESGLSIVDLKMFRKLDIVDGEVNVTVALTINPLVNPLGATVKKDVADALSSLPEIKKVDVQLVQMSEEEKKEVAAIIQAKAPPPAKQTGQRAGPRSRAAGIDRLENPNIKKVVAIASGKGGVGKSLVTGLLASELKRQGFKVGILDADLTGSSIAKIFGVTSRPTTTSIGVEPPRSKSGIKLVSMNLLMDRDDSALIWRGPMVNNAIRQLFSELEWGELDYMLVDLPPGTSDAPLTVYQSLPVSGVVIVSSPQDLAVMIVGKAVAMARTMNVPILGLIENMQYLRCSNCDHKTELYGRPKGEEAAKAWEIKYLGGIPVDPRISRLCDDGQIEKYEKTEFSEIAKYVAKKSMEIELVTPVISES